MRGRDGGEPPDGPGYTVSSCHGPHEWQIEENEAIFRMKTDELDRLVAAGTINEIDRERVERFIVRGMFSLMTGPMIPCPRMRLEGASSVELCSAPGAARFSASLQELSSDKECCRKSIELSSATRTRDQSTRSRCALHGKDATHNNIFRLPW